MLKWGTSIDEVTLNWPWHNSLAMARRHEALQISRILFGSVKDHCRDIGLREGSILICRGADDKGVDVQLASGREHRIPRHYAWFVSVDRI